MLKQRLQMSASEVQSLSFKIQEKLMQSSFWPKQGGIALYSSIKNEVKTELLFQTALEQAVHVYFPRVEQGINFYEVHGPEDLQKGSWGILEPHIDCTKLTTENPLNLLIVPGVAFSKSCQRVGYGQGFYDQFVSSLNTVPHIVALAYESQICDMFDVDEWDQPLYAIITEKNIYTQD